MLPLFSHWVGNPKPTHLWTNRFWTIPLPTLACQWRAETAQGLNWLFVRMCKEFKTLRPTRHDYNANLWIKEAKVCVNFLVQIKHFGFYGIIRIISVLKPTPHQIYNKSLQYSYKVCRFCVKSYQFSTYPCQYLKYPWYPCQYLRYPSIQKCGCEEWFDEGDMPHSELWQQLWQSWIVDIDM